MRFTLKTLIAAISFAAVLCCIFFTLPAILVIPLLVLMWMMIPPALIAGIVYGRGYGRAFSIGCIACGGIFPVMWIYASMTMASLVTDWSNITIDNEVGIYLKVAFGASCILMGLSGLSSMTVRWLSLKFSPAAVQAMPNRLPEEYSVIHRRLTTLPANPTHTDDRDGNDERSTSEGT